LPVSRAACIVVRIAGALMVLAQAGIDVAAADGPYAVDWHSIDGGDVRAAGAGHAVHATVGQPDAEPLQPAAGGPYALVSGFHAIEGKALSDALFRDGFEATVPGES
jgi:hypothetical protein